MLSSVHIEGIEYKTYLIKVLEHMEPGNWAYIIYEKKKDKWKKKRSIQHYLTRELATEAAQKYIDNHY